MNEDFFLPGERLRTEVLPTSYWTHTARVRIRRDPKFGPVRPEAEQINGKIYFFKFGWEDDTGRYSGEEIWVPCDTEYPLDAPLWIAAGDLQFGDEP